MVQASVRGECETRDGGGPVCLARVALRLIALCRFDPPADPSFMAIYLYCLVQCAVVMAEIQDWCRNPGLLGVFSFSL